MSTIQLTNNNTLDVTASSADENATINRYLTESLSFLTSSGLHTVTGKKVGDLDAAAFPITASPTDAGTFAVEGMSLGISLGASASVNLLKGSSATDCCTALQLPQDPAASSIVSFELQGTLSAGLTAKVDDFCFGITQGATVTLASSCPAANTDTFAEAVKRAIAALTIPHDVTDLKSLPAGAICQLDASSCLKFTASVTYNILNNPLATLSISKLPGIAVNAKAGATLEAAATHTSGHTLMIAKLANGRIHLSVSLTRIDDFETSLTASTGLTATVGGQDALSFLLDKISPDSQAEMQKIEADMPAAQVKKLRGDIKAAIDASLCSSLQASLKTALDDSRSNKRIFLYEIDLNALDGVSTAALHSALTGDFTTMTANNTALAGIRQLDSALTITSKVKHSLTVHLLGIFNYGSTNIFIEKSTVDYTKDTHEIVLSDETIQVVGNNLDSEKLREVVAKGITLTLPAAANTTAATGSINMVFFDRQAGTSPSLMRQFVNVLRATGASSAALATSLISGNLKNYGTSSLSLSLNLTAPQCRQLFLESTGNPHDWTTFVGYACDAQAIILADDPDNTDRLKLFTAGLPFWKQLNTAASPPQVVGLLADQGIRENALVDVVTVLWWSFAMAAYARALAAHESLEGPGKKVVKDSTRGFKEPWMIVATWNMLQNPAIDSLFTCLPPPRAVGSVAG